MKRKGLIKICIVLVIIGIMSFSDWSFAEESNELIEEFGKILTLVVSILSWIWVFFARGAGEFLTNKWVYGEIIGLDAILWQYRNVIKNIANFGLGFYFVYLIFKGLIDQFTGGAEVTKMIKDKLMWILIAGVGIQASWFMTAVVIDISTITLTAAGSFPSMVISNNTEAKGAIKTSLENCFGKLSELKNGMRLSLFSPDMGLADFITITKDIPLDEPMTESALFDKIMPDSESISGPLYYLGFVIMKSAEIVSPNTTDTTGWKSTIFNILMQGGTTIIYSIEMLVLLVLAVMRVIYMWMFIVLSPIVVLLRCMKKSGTGGKNSKGGAFDEFSKHINFTSFFWNAFKPTLVVLGFSLAIIFTSLMNEKISKEKTHFDLSGVTTDNVNTGTSGEGNGNKKYLTVLNTDTTGIVIRDVGKTFFELLLCILTVVFVYIIIRIFVNMGGGDDFVSKGIKKLQSNVQEGIAAMPLMPVAGYDDKGKPTTRFLSAGKVFGFGERNEYGNNLRSKKLVDYHSMVSGEENRQNAIINSWFGNKTGYLTTQEENAIKTAGTGKIGIAILTAKKGAIPMTDEGKGMTLDGSSNTSKFWIGEFGDWLTNMKGKTVSGSSNDTVWNNMITWWNDHETDRTLEKMFKNNASGEGTSIQVYAQFFFEEGDKRRGITSWDQLKDADISKKKEKEEDKKEAESK